MDDADTQSRGGKTVEETYKRKTLLQHIIDRPDQYIGSVQRHSTELWVVEEGKMVWRTVEYVPGLYKIFDEILVNAADNKARDAAMNKLQVDLKQEENSIKVWNNGAGVPVDVHKDEQIYVPEMIFGHLLTSSNYDDDEKRVTGGRNGYGAKLANIFSTEFTIETCDSTRQKKYKQRFSKNMSEKRDPQINSCKSSSYTSVTFRPDLPKFQMQRLEEDTMKLLTKRVYDMAGVLGSSVKVLLNSDRLAVKSFSDYVNLYIGPPVGGIPRVHQRINDRWEVAVAATDGQFQQVSFVNSICTSKGGTHVKYIVDQITKCLVEKMSKKNKQCTIKPFHIRNHLWVFVNCQIENPAFDSQTKETLTTKVSEFGSKCQLPPAFIDKVAKCGVGERVASFAEYKSQQQMKKSDGSKRSRLTGVPKLNDANHAGTNKSANCTLILTEGDSAKALAMSGLSVVGRDAYGVFPLRGKLLNVRDATSDTVANNEEIQNLKKILGLQHGRVYTTLNGLRYGHLMIMTDQDHDGSHIKGLIINFIHCFYPSLATKPGFMQQFITPIIKASKGREVKVFYTLTEYENWKESLGGRTAKWSVKYYKGLGTSTAKEAKEYFADLKQHRKEFEHSGQPCDESIKLAFDKTCTADRKVWLNSFEEGTYLDNSIAKVTYDDFINKELIHFSRADLVRSVPSLVDGLKPGQRKVMFSGFKRNLKKDIRVSQFAGYVSEHSGYHHGEESLCQTIIKLAQDFVGSNNISLLYPSGQFGTRLQGGKDAASARYLFTRLGPLARHVFNEADDQLLNYLTDDLDPIEPEWYMPILPMVLVNGAEGIGTGWRSSIPNYDPKQIVANLRRMLSGEEPEAMHPWYRGFKGSITYDGPQKQSYTVEGLLKNLGDGRLQVEELPLRKWTQEYKEFLEKLVNPEEGAPLLCDIEQFITDVSVEFVLHCMPDFLPETADHTHLLDKLKLKNKLSLKNLTLFDAKGRIKVYKSAEEILREFFDLRLEYYGKRKEALLKCARAELRRLDNKKRFVLAVVEGRLLINNRRKAEIIFDLERIGVDKLSPGKPQVRVAAQQEEEGEEGAAEESGATYDYLLNIPIYGLTYEKVKELEEKVRVKEEELKVLENTTPKQMWHTDLDAFMETYAQIEAEAAAEEQRLIEQQKRMVAQAGRKPACSQGRSQGRSKGRGRAVKATTSSRGGPPKAPKRPRAGAKSNASGSMMTQSMNVTNATRSRKEPSLAERLKGRLGKSSMRSGGVSRAISISESESEGEEEVKSPLPAHMAKFAAKEEDELPEQGAKLKKRKIVLSSSSDDENGADNENVPGNGMGSYFDSPISIDLAPKTKVARLQKSKEGEPQDILETTGGQREHVDEVKPARPRRGCKKKADVMDLTSDVDNDDSAPESSGSEYEMSDD